MSPITATAGPAFTDAQALAALLTTEGFLLAAVALAVNLDAPGQPRARQTIVSFRSLAIASAIVLALAATGAIVAWARIFFSGECVDFSQAIIAICLAIVIVAQPVIALLLSLGSKTS